MADRISQIQARVALGRGRPAGLSGGTTARPVNPGIGQARPAEGRIGIGPGRPARGAPIGVGQGVPLPSAPTAPTPTPPLAQRPWNAQFELARGAAEKGYGDKLSNLASQKVIAQQNFGIDQGFNDYINNPYSRAALLRKSYEANARGDLNSYAARGQLYAGSLANAREGDQETYNQGYDALNKEYLQNLGGLSQEEARALENKENEIIEAGWKALEAAQNEPIEPVPAKGIGKPGTNTGKPGKSYGKFPFYPNPGSLPNAKPKANLNSKVKEGISQRRKAR